MILRRPFARVDPGKFPLAFQFGFVYSRWRPAAGPTRRGAGWLILSLGRLTVTPT
jgi:hypothetical protein